MLRGILAAQGNLKPIGRRKGQPYGLFNLPALARILLADSTGAYLKAR